jgi:threonine dehydrogenase-like Zn-dependent dehydrogenase
MPNVLTCIKAAPGRVELARIDLPDPGPGQALIRTTLSTICGSDLHIRDDIPEVPVGMPMGHEGVGVIEAVGEGVTRFKRGDRVVSCCLQSCGTCEECVTLEPSVCSTFGAPMNLLFGCQGEAFLVGGADNTLARVPDGMPDRIAIFTADVMSTGFGAIERAGVRAGQSVAIFAQGPVGLCATMGAHYYGAEPIIAVESVPARVALAHRLGATHVVPPDTAVERILELTHGKGVHVAVEALGKQQTFESCCRVVRFGGTVSSVGVYGGVDSLRLPTDGSFVHRSIVTTFCPAGSPRMERMLRLMDSGDVDPSPLVTHSMKLADLVRAYDVFAARADGCVKIAIEP